MDESAMLRGVLVLGLALFGFGAYDPINGPGTRHLTGLGFGIFGGLLVASLVMRYERPGLTDPKWSTTWRRRAAHVVLAHTWRIMLALLMVNAVVYLVLDWL